MREAVRQSINVGSRELNSKETACDIWIIHDALDLLQTAPWNFGIDVNEPENVATRGARTGVHLYRSTGLTHDKLVARAGHNFNRAIRASTVCNNNLCAGCPLAQMREKRP
jgi:hypothetical protein